MPKNVKRFLKTFLISLAILTGLIIFYYFSLLSLYSFPERKLQEHLTEAYAFLDMEGVYPAQYTYAPGNIMDNSTDRIMLERLPAIPGMSAKFSILYMWGYGRYWHGYVLFLKPLMFFFSYLRIRNFMSLIHIFLFAAVLCRLYKRFGARTAVPFAISWAGAYSYAVCASMQYFYCYTVMLAGMLFITCRYRKETETPMLAYFFVVMGSLINFLDLLTFPLVTLTMPLLLVLLIDISEKNLPFKKVGIHILVSSLAWGLSYAITWVSKWVLALTLIKSQVVRDALKQAIFRIKGDGDHPIDRVKVLTANIDNMMFLKYFLYSIIPWLILIAAVFVFRRWKMLLAMLPLLIIAVLPYVWYEVLCNHSLQHNFFTFRAQLGTLFAILLLFSYCMIPDRESWRSADFPKRFKKKIE